MADFKKSSLIFVAINHEVVSTQFGLTLVKITGLSGNVAFAVMMKMR